MAYKISGTLNESARILVLKESDWSIESNVEKSAGDYEIENLVSGTKTVVAIDGNGEVVGYGMVSPEFYGGDRGVFGGGYNNGPQNIMDYITISTTGDAIDFGDLSIKKFHMAATSNGSNDRGVFGGGRNASDNTINTIEYITITTPGNTTDFGDLTQTRGAFGAASNGINDRGVFGGGTFYDNQCVNTIDYITISTTGNATDFGDLTIKRRYLSATSNGTNDRAVFNSGYDVGNNALNIIAYITISTTGNAIDFGDLTRRKMGTAATSNTTNNRGIFGGGYTGSSDVQEIDYINIATTGNATDFGDLSGKRSHVTATSNGTNNRGVFGGGYVYDGGNTRYNIIEYITISTIGNASDFGDLTFSRSAIGAVSNVYS